MPTTSVRRVSTVSSAKEVLAAAGLQFDRMLHRPFTSRFERQPSIHIYFMQGDCDVGYLTPMTDTLVLHDVPRKWHTSFLEGMETYEGY